MQQRVGIAAAMLLSPGVLLADEPTSALDVTLQKQVVEEMRMVRDTFGTAIVLVAHNLGVIGAMADNVLVLKDGKTVEYGKTGDVLTNPQADYTRALLAAVPRLRRCRHGTDPESQRPDQNLLPAGAGGLYRREKYQL